MSIYWIVASVTGTYYSATANVSLARSWPKDVGGRALGSFALSLVIGAMCGVMWPLTIIPLIQQAGRRS